MKVSIYVEPAFGNVSFLFYEEKNGKRFVVKPTEFELIENTDYAPIDPTFRLTRIDAEQFMQSFCDCADTLGIKQKSKTATDSQLAATQYHLEDMRKLVFTEEEVRSEVRGKRDR